MPVIQTLTNGGRGWRIPVGGRIGIGRMVPLTVQCIAGVVGELCAGCSLVSCRGWTGLGWIIHGGVAVVKILVLG